MAAHAHGARNRIRLRTDNEEWGGVDWGVILTCSLRIRQIQGIACNAKKKIKSAKI
jgi:hypothetical protein